jgi:large subunit ribosomal protein L30e
MPENLELEKQLKLAKRTGSYLVGRREVLSGIKGSKLLVWSDSSNLPQAILDQSRDLSIPAIKFNGNPVELGRACGIPFRVSVIAVKTQGDADLTAFTKSADYVSVPSGNRALLMDRMPEQAVEPEKVSKEVMAKPKKESKEKKEPTKTGVKKKSKSKEEEPDEKEPEAGKTKEKKTKSAKKSSDAPKKSKKKKTEKEDEDEE